MMQSLSVMDSSDSVEKSNTPDRFMIINLGYDAQFIFSIEDGIQILELLSKDGTRKLETGYKKPVKLSAPGEFKVSIISQQELNEKILEAAISGEEL